MESSSLQADIAEPLLSISAHDKRQKSPLTPRINSSTIRERIAFFLLLLCASAFACVIFLICGNFVYSDAHQVPYAAGNVANNLDYGVVVDCGSTGSRLHIFSWPHRTNDSVPLPAEMMTNATITQLPLCSNPGLGNMPPLAAFASNLTGLQDFSRTIMECVMEVVPQAALATTPVFVYATAGMRVIPQQDQTNIVTTLQNYMENDYNALRFYRVQVIPGSFEGYYGWVTLNYALGTFFNKSAPSAGALDLGGMSTQMTWQPQSPDLALSNSDPDTHLVTFHGRTFSVYANSFLYYGRDGVDDQVLNILLNQQPSTAVTTFVNPCDPDGFSRMWSPASAPTQQYNVTGSSDLNSCNSILDLIYNISAPCASSSCSFNGQFQPPMNAQQGQFYAFSNFFYTESFLRQVTPALTATPTLDQFAASVTQLCSMSWGQLQATYGANPQLQPFLSQYCFDGAMIIKLLVRGYGFPTTTNQITFASKLNGFSLDWALGAIINEANLLPLTYTVPEQTKHLLAWHPHGWILLLASGALSVMFALIFVLSYRQRQRLQKKQLLSKSTINVNYSV